MRPGTDEHKELFCTTFIDSHRSYDPRELPWPRLEPQYLERLRAIPFWGTARATETKAGEMVSGFAQMVEDPLIRRAIAMQGVEEHRHAVMMGQLVERYNLPAPNVVMPNPVPSKDEFVSFGYEECLDAYMGYALFGLASKTNMFPASFMAIFEEILFEETRHVTFFINWFRYEEARAGRDKLPGRLVVAVKNYIHSLRRLIDSFSGDVAASGFAASNATSLVPDLTPVTFLECAISENRRFMGMLDARLKKPALLPALSTVALMALQALPPRQNAAALTRPQSAAA